MDSCAKILLSQSEYVYLNDSIIRVNRTNNENIFETDSFEKTENGSVLICAPETVTDNADKFSAAQGLVSSICLIISLICLAVHILVYVLLPKLRNLPGMNLLSLSCSIFVAQLLFLTVVNIAVRVPFHFLIQSLYCLINSVETFHFRGHTYCVLPLEPQHTCRS